MFLNFLQVQRNARMIRSQQEILVLSDQIVTGLIKKIIDHIGQFVAVADEIS
jgi:hypothetical protein